MLQPLSLASLLFTGLILMIAATISVPTVVYADNIQGTSADDTLNGTPRADTINGLEGNDNLFGKTGNDILDGDEGNDEIYGEGGNDRINDGNNEDGETNRVYAGSGNDKIDVGTVDGTGITYYIYGEAGSDYIEVIAHEAYVNGGPNHDTIYCTAQFCAVEGNEGHDEIHINPLDTANYAIGGSGNDRIYSTAGGHLEGEDGNDYLYGGSEKEGGEGNDVLEGGGGFYIGGPGADTFICSTGPRDIVEDYNPEEGDKIVNIGDCETVEGT
jgi:Ca2+-binding RTX toxin-like protein